jgi:hypothetical protein
MAYTTRTYRRPTHPANASAPCTQCPANSAEGQQHVQVG